MKPSRSAQGNSPLFDTTAYAVTWPQRFRRVFDLGPKYYLRDIPRYLRQRIELGLPLSDWPVLFNPVRSFRPRTYAALQPPPRLDEAMRLLQDADVHFDNPRLRVEALSSVWWQTRHTPGAVIECGAFRGSTSLLLAVLGRLNEVSQKVLMLDTFSGMPNPSPFDHSRKAGEYAPPSGWGEVLGEQGKWLGVNDRLEVHAGLFVDTFAKLSRKNLELSFVHIDANIYQGTLDACRFTIPRVAPGGAVVFDDYNGLCDLGARLAIDEYLGARRLQPEPLAECSAYIRL